MIALGLVRRKIFSAYYLSILLLKYARSSRQENRIMKCHADENTHILIHRLVYYV
jgi:hypothetical protein